NSTGHEAPPGPVGREENLPPPSDAVPVSQMPNVATCRCLAIEGTRNAPAAATLRRRHAPNDRHVRTSPRDPNTFPIMPTPPITANSAPRFCRFPELFAFGRVALTR